MDAFTYNVKVKRRHCEASHFAFSDKDNMIQTEREDYGETSTTKCFRSDCTHCNIEIVQC